MSFKYTLLLIALFLLTGQSVLFGQSMLLQGQVTDSTETSIPYTNIIATPLIDNPKIAFAITDVKGHYEFNLQSGISYKVEISHLGYSKITDTINITQNTNKNYNLQESSETLEQVIIRQEIPVIVKQDTIIYRVDSFKTGEERKLREVLKKLPGVEVDREGNIKVNGKSVTKLMVEGKTFFTGDSKLAVNNIPSEVIDEIVILDNYNEIPFLKGLTESNQMALDIKLKKGKKEFVFGDLEAGVGIENRFLLHPTLFYYSPKTAVNMIVDVNNIGEKSFTLNDYINFEGGFASLLEDPSALKDLHNSEFVQFLNQKDFVRQKNDFAAGSIYQELSPFTHLEAFSIINKSKTATRNSNSIYYLIDPIYHENRESTTDNNMVFSLNKFKLRYQPNFKTDLAYNAAIKTSKGDALQDIISISDKDSIATNSLQELKDVSIHQEVQYNKEFSYNHTSTITAKYDYSSQKNNHDWLFNQPIFSDLIPYEEEEFYHVLQNASTVKHKASIDLKHYWALNRFHHIYPRIGSTFSKESFSTLDSQLLQNGISNDFQESGFNNDTDFRLIDNYIGLQYKAKAGSFIFTPGLMYHLYSWKANQFSEEIVSKQKNVLLPELRIKHEISSSESIEANYQLKTDFSDVQHYANRLRLMGFNQLYRGNEALENQLYHTASLNYSQFNFFKGIYINASLNYTKRKKSIRNITQMEGIDQINTSIYTDSPEKNYAFGASVGKQLGKYRVTFQGNLNLADYTRIINEKPVDYQANNYGYTLKAETSFKEGPNFEIGWEHLLNKIKSGNSENNFTQISPYALLNWNFLNDFILSADFSYNYNKLDTNSVSRFKIGSASLFYNQEDSPWGFEIDVNNIFDVRYKTENSFNQFLMMNRSTYIQPRTILFKLSYKL